MDQQLLHEINSGFGNLRKRLEELEKIHCRYQGPRGEKGAPAKVSVGRVEVGDTASVKVRPLDGNIYELDFVLPPGKDGRDGRDGVDGVSNIPGPRGRDGRDGVDGRVVVGQVVGGHFAAATVHVADDVQIIDLVVPRGGEGPRGPQGEQGLQGERGPQGEGGAQGPQGERGPPGPTGRNGADGKDGLRGPQGKPGDISAAVAQAEAEARSVVEEALAAVHERLARLERAGEK